MGITPGSADQRFPGYDVTKESKRWDSVTTAVVLRRMAPSETPTFFTQDEEPTARALLDRLLAQDDDPKISVFEMIDQRLAEGRGDGYHYVDLAADPETWRRSIASLDADALARRRLAFCQLSRDEQRDIIEEVRLNRGQWHGLPAGRVFSLWMRYACSAFYSHPWAWNEIGFGGPAYPRGYKHLAFEGREPWEVREHGAEDPIPWVEQAEAAKKRHAEGLTPHDPASYGDAANK